MKTIQTLIALFLFATCGYAQNTSTPPESLGQSPENVPNMAENANTGKMNLSAQTPVRDLAALHNQSVIAQLTQHLITHIEYPAAMVNSGIEGQTIVRVSISEKGKVTRPVIVKSIHPEFDQAVLKAMKMIDAIQIKEATYQGSGMVNVPINFRTSPRF